MKASAGNTTTDRGVKSSSERDRIVISGMSGLFPEAQSVQEFADILYNKVNPVTSENSPWLYTPLEIGPYSGKAPGSQYFDAQFFKVHQRLGEKMDVMSRKLLEQSYQAIYDAGLSPQSLNGKNVAVYIGTSISETEITGFLDTSSKRGFGIMGCSKTMFANRISYWLNVKGPSMAVDQACCSSMSALQLAYLAMKSNECEAAIVGGCHLSMLPESSVHYNRINKIAKDGKTRSFDQEANGCVLSDAINVIFLQKASDALRVYADVVHAKNEYISLKQENEFPKSGSYRKPHEIANYLKDFYIEADFAPQDVDYVEAFGIGNPESDKSELEALTDVFCDKKTNPLYVGSVMSNIGFTAAASGITSIIKVLLGYHNGLFAGNLHYNTPRHDINAIKDGRICILDDHCHINGNYAAVNAFSVTGVNAHVLLKGNRKPKDLAKYKSSIPHLVTVSGRQDSSVKKVLDNLKSRPIDPEELTLFHNIHSVVTPGHLGRGYTILQTQENQTVSLGEAVNYFDNAKRPLWFVYSGMGSQWPGMGAELMNIPIFSAAIERCQKAVESKGIDLVKIITSTDPDIFNNILNAFLGIAAIQIGLTDVTYALGLVPDNIIGHSVGELGCAYADGCLTAEEMILAAYSRGQASIETKLIKGSMAAIGMGYKQILPLCPPEVDVACHNGPDSSTISGPADVTAHFVAELSAKGIFAKTVPSANIAYHSRYIAAAGSNLLQMLKKVIKNPRLRSERWVSTSVPQEDWNNAAAKYCSPEYQTNNLLNPVLFEETSRLIPNNAILIEIAPRGLLQAILKRSVSPDCFNISLTKKGDGNVIHLLQTIGKLYIEGCTPDIKALYPKVELPVSAGTPMLSQLVKWMHLQEWYVPKPQSTEIITCAVCEHFISVHDKEHSYLRGNIAQGKMIYPIGGILVLVWDTLCMSMLLPKKKVSVKFSDVHIEVQPILCEEKILRLRVAINKGNGRFEVTNAGSKVASGIIFTTSKNVINKMDHAVTSMELNKNDVYQLLWEKGYSFSEEFRLIKSANTTLSEAIVEWRDNWVTLIENMLQLNILNQNDNGVSLPAKISDVILNIFEHEKPIFSKDSSSTLKVIRSEVYDSTECGGVILKGIRFRQIPRISYPTSLLVPSSKDKTELIKLKIQTSSCSNTMLLSAEPGNINSIHWSQVFEPSGSGILVKVHYASLTPIDGEKATGAVSHQVNEICYGMDYSGVTESGHRVMGIVHRGACRNYLRAHPDLLWPVPDHWSLEDAATVPLAYAYAFYCLMIKAKLYSGMKILIHEGAGALGQAAISIALAHKCQVFTTVGDVRMKSFLKKLYPELKEQHIGNSRDVTFGDMVLSATNGKGCDIVICSVEPWLKHVSLQCGGALSIIIDTAQMYNQNKFELRMNSLINDRSYVIADFVSMFDFAKNEEFKKLQILVSGGISKGYVRPLGRVTYAADEAPRALRLLSKSWHRGHVLLRLTDRALPASLRINCTSKCSHLIIFSDEYFGIQLAKRLINRGARMLHICCSKPSWYLQHQTENLKSLGVNVIVSSNNLNDLDDVATVLKKTIAMGPVEGVYLTSFKDMDNKYISNSLEYLDVMSRKFCPSLKYFAVITNSENVGKQTSIFRAKDNLVISRIEVQKPDFCGDTNTEVLLDRRAWDLSLLGAVETGLCSKLPLLVAQIKTETLPLYQQLADVADLPLLKEAGDMTTLQDLAAGSDNIKLIKEFLRLKYHVCISEHNVLKLNKQKLREIDFLANNFEHKQGLAVYFSHIAEDELSSDTPIYLLPTLGNANAEKQVDALKSEYLCVVPGIEGHHVRFRGLCERLKLPALVLQPSLNVLHETIEQAAQSYSKVPKIFNLTVTSNC
uniref:Ketosynthase family 3 (KS3) domain-containing protein n=1 Tax=Bombyx mori TaxID=7091 RepID=A0A8R2QYX5_BOMMO|nr:fatty acid synthase isoform X4 [Bombyx mori]